MSEIQELMKLAKYWEDRTFDTEVKLESVERERDSLKRQLAEANATCAAMREALEEDARNFEAVDDIHPEWAEKALDGLNNIVR